MKSGIIFGVRNFGTIMMLAFGLSALGTSAQAQQYQLLYTFSNEPAGGPHAGLTWDAQGNLYGTGYYGSFQGQGCEQGGCGTAFKLSYSGSRWHLQVLEGFQPGRGGVHPIARVVFGPDGALYGTTRYGSFYSGPTVFRLPTAGCISTGCRALYTFPTDTQLNSGDLIFDQAGDIYGTTLTGGPFSGGTAYKLTSNDNTWAETVLYNFGPGPLGFNPSAGLISDDEGNLYGATSVTSYAAGNVSTDCSVFELSPVGGSWSAKILHHFVTATDGGYILGGLVFDRSGNLYGTTSVGGPQGGGTVFELSPSSGGWTLTTLYGFTGNGPGSSGPAAALTMDADGNLYGTTMAEGLYGYGNVFKLTKAGNGWSYNSLHDFAFDDGYYPLGQVILDSGANIFGTTSTGGPSGWGVVWEITA